jgi:hypothetical protein
MAKATLSYSPPGPFEVVVGEPMTDSIEERFYGSE